MLLSVLFQWLRQVLNVLKYDVVNVIDYVNVKRCFDAVIRLSSQKVLILLNKDALGVDLPCCVWLWVCPFRQLCVFGCPGCDAGCVGCHMSHSCSSIPACKFLAFPDTL